MSGYIKVNEFKKLEEEANYIESAIIKSIEEATLEDYTNGAFIAYKDINTDTIKVAKYRIEIVIDGRNFSRPSVNQRCSQRTIDRMVRYINLINKHWSNSFKIKYRLLDYDTSNFIGYTKSSDIKIYPSEREAINNY